MSTIELIIKENGRMHHHTMHYREAIEMVGNAVCSKPMKLPANKPQHWVDAGYILLDLDDQVVLSNQTGFAQSRLSSEARNRLRTSWASVWM